MSRQPKALLSRGEHKSLQTDRVILTPGPEPEQQVIQGIYQAFVKEGRSEADIAAQLNRRGLRTDWERPWTRGVVHQVLINEKYIGNNVWNRTSGKLKQPRTRNPIDQWVRADGAFSLWSTTHYFSRRRPSSARVHGTGPMSKCWSP